MNGATKAHPIQDRRPRLRCGRAVRGAALRVDIVVIRFLFVAWQEFALPS
jgi:hypothetical protein